MANDVAADAATYILDQYTQGARGVPVALGQGRFPIARFVRKLTNKYFKLEAEQGREQPHAVLGMRSPYEAERLLNDVNASLPPDRQGEMLTHLTPGDKMSGVLLCDFVTLESAAEKFGKDAFDLLILKARKPGELERFMKTLTTLEPRLLVLVFTASMCEPENLEQWPALTTPYLAQ